MLYVDEVRSTSSMSADELTSHAGKALDNWALTHDKHQHENSTSNFISYPAAAYLRMSLYTDIENAMRAFLQKDFTAMREVLRRSDDLVEASRHAIDGLVPWTVSHRNQISMVSVPCGMCRFSCSGIFQYTSDD
jgi:hypothetical protein